jgi:hypothetical protein
MSNFTTNEILKIAKEKQKKGLGLFEDPDRDILKEFDSILKSINNKKESEKLGCGMIIFLLIFFAIGFPIGFLWFGFILMMLWNWFMVPAGMTPIGIGVGMGLWLFFNFLKLWLSTEKTDPKLEEKYHPSVIGAVRVVMFWLVGGIVLGTGWLIQFFFLV